jgi:hypothetical protein
MPSTPAWFQYDYPAQDVGTGHDQFQAIAVGDLDGDGVTSRFVYRGVLQANRVTFAPAIEENGAGE